METVKLFISTVIIGVLIVFTIQGASSFFGWSCCTSSVTYYLNHQKDYTVDTIRHSNGVIEYEAHLK